MENEKVDEQLIELFYRYLLGTCNHEEIDRVIELLQQGLYQREWKIAINRLADTLYDGEEQAVITPEESEHLHQRILNHVQEQQMPVHRSIWHKQRWFPYVAAVIFVALAAGTWFYIEISSHRRLSTSIELVETDLHPTGNRATLTLSDGQKINLNESKEGIAMKYNRISYQNESEEIVNLKDNDLNNLVLTTPKGGTYSVVLSDGSRVWLNAASRLKYPSKFSASQRLVEIEGEAYFAIVRDAKRPFSVRSQGQEIEVLGTEFNVSAYLEDKEIKTTLVSGAVQVVAIAAEKGKDNQQRQQKNGIVNRLSPGEQSTLRQGELSIDEVDVTTYVGWKDGDFVFNGLELRDAMKQLSRWYDVDVVYEGDIPPTPFYGSFSRTLPLPKALEILKEGQVNFSLQKQGARNRLIVKQ